MITRIIFVAALFVVPFVVPQEKAWTWTSHAMYGFFILLLAIVYFVNEEYQGKQKPELGNGRPRPCFEMEIDKCYQVREFVIDNKHMRRYLITYDQDDSEPTLWVVPREVPDFDPEAEFIVPKRSKSQNLFYLDVQL